MIKNVFELYNRHLIQIILLSLILTIPVTLFMYFATNYFYQQLTNDQYPNLYALFLIILNFTLLIPSFQLMAKRDINDEEEPTLLQLMLEFFKHIGIIVLISLPLFIIGIYGSILLFIPTFICFSIMLLLPFFVGRKKLKDVFSGVGTVLKNENIFLLVDFLIIVSLQFLVWGFMMLVFASFENNYYVYGMARALVNALIYPLLIFFLTFRYCKQDHTILTRRT